MYEGNCRVRGHPCLLLVHPGVSFEPHISVQLPPPSTHTHLSASMMTTLKSPKLQFDEQIASSEEEDSPTPFFAPTLVSLVRTTLTTPCRVLQKIFGGEGEDFLPNKKKSCDKNISPLYSGMLRRKLKSFIYYVCLPLNVSS